MKKKYGLLILFSTIILTISVFAVRLYVHEKWQSQQIHKLIAEQTELFNNGVKYGDVLSDLQKRFSNVEDTLYSRVEYTEEAFNYLAIGNSITLHEKCDYWWNEIGMAASIPEKDYFHLVSEYLLQTYNEANTYAFNFAIWEIQSADRTQTISALEKYVSSKLDLITIQLSENVTNLDTFVSDTKEMIAFLQEKCPSAKIILVDDFWSNEKSNLKHQIAAESGVSFASLENIRGKAEYMCGLNAIVYGDDNTSHTVEHGGVAAHPGDRGMQAIADSIIDILKGEV